MRVFLPMRGLPPSSMSIMLPAGEPQRVDSRVHRVIEASVEWTKSFQRDVTLGSRVVTQAATLPSSHLVSLSTYHPMTWDGQDGLEYA